MLTLVWTAGTIPQLDTTGTRKRPLADKGLWGGLCLETCACIEYKYFFIIILEHFVKTRLIIVSKERNCLFTLSNQLMWVNKI